MHEAQQRHQAGGNYRVGPLDIVAAQPGRQVAQGHEAGENTKQRDDERRVDHRPHPLRPSRQKAEAEQEVVKAREALREDVATLAVKGAEQILKREINAGVHAELLGRLKAEL